MGTAFGKEFEAVRQQRTLCDVYIFRGSPPGCAKRCFGAPPRCHSTKLLRGTPGRRCRAMEDT